MSPAERHAQLVLWAQQLLVKGLPLDAHAVAERAVREAPEDVFARILWVRALLSLGKARRAETEAAAALSTARTDGERGLALSVLALALAAGSKASAGIEPAREAVRLMEGDPRALMALVLCLAEGGHQPEARQLAEQLENLAPLESPPYLMLAIVEIAEGQTEEAELSLRRAVELDEDDEGLALELAAVLLSQKKRAQALESLIHAAERNPESELVRTATVQTALMAKGAHVAVFFFIWFVLVGPWVLGVLFGDRALIPIVSLLIVGVLGFVGALVKFSRTEVPPGAQRLLEQQARIGQRQARRSLANTLLGIGLVLSGFQVLMFVMVLIVDPPSADGAGPLTLVAVLIATGCFVGLRRVRRAGSSCKCQDVSLLTDREARRYARQHLRTATNTPSDGDPIEFICPATDRRWILHKPSGFNKSTRLAQLAPSSFG